MGELKLDLDIHGYLDKKVYEEPIAIIAINSEGSGFLLKIENEEKISDYWSEMGWGWFMEDSVFKSPPGVYRCRVVTHTSQDFEGEWDNWETFEEMKPLFLLEGIK